jgi:hypothetical protein
MHFSSILLLAVSAFSVSGAVIKRDARSIIEAIGHVSEAVARQDSVIARFPRSASFDDFDAAGDALSDRFGDLVKAVHGSGKLDGRESRKVTDALIQLVPTVKHGLQLVVDKKPEFVAIHKAGHVHEELNSDVAYSTKIVEGLQEKLTITNVEDIMALAGQVGTLFSSALRAYKDY